MKKNILYLSILFIVFSLFISLFVAYKIVRINGRISNEEPSFYIPTIDANTTAAYFQSCNQDSAKGTIILIHGIGANHHQFDPVLHKIHNMGYHTVSVDNRSHNKSSGYCTYGVKEKKDIQLLTQKLKKNSSKYGDKIGVWGHSLGGAIALQAMAINPEIDFGVIQSTFSYFPATAQDYWQRITHIKSEWVMNYLLWWAGKIADFDPKKASPIDACKKIKQPIFITHGVNDSNIPFEYGKNNFEAIASKQKVFYPVPNADHNNLWTVGGTTFFEKIDNFLSTLN